MGSARDEEDCSIKHLGKVQIDLDQLLSIYCRSYVPQVRGGADQDAVANWHSEVMVPDEVSEEVVEVPQARILHTDDLQRSR